MAIHLKLVIVTCLFLLVLMEHCKPTLAKKGEQLKQRTKILEKSVVELKDKIKVLEECQSCSKIKELNDAINELRNKIDSKPTCPDGWVLHGHSCYRIFDTPTLQWSEARKTCQGLAADLAIVKSASENKFIFDLVKGQQRVTDLGAWLGLYRKSDNSFYWIDDTPLVGQYSAWASGEPNNIQEKCGHLYATGSSQGKWNDIPCTLGANHLSYAPVILCQKST